MVHTIINNIVGQWHNYYIDQEQHTKPIFNSKCNPRHVKHNALGFKEISHARSVVGLKLERPFQKFES